MKFCQECYNLLDRSCARCHRTVAEPPKPLRPRYGLTHKARDAEHLLGDDFAKLRHKATLKRQRRQRGRAAGLRVA